MSSFLYDVDLDAGVLLRGAASVGEDASATSALDDILPDWSQEVCNPSDMGRTSQRLTQRQIGDGTSGTAAATRHAGGLPAQVQQRAATKWFEPLPFRRGFADIMRIMTERKWSQETISSIERALAKVCELWFAREDGLHLNDLIQLHVQWAIQLGLMRDFVFPNAPIAMIACRKAGGIYSSNQLARDLLSRSAQELQDGNLACYELMTETSAARFFALYRRAVEAPKDSDGAVQLRCDFDLVSTQSDSIISTRGVFHMKFTSVDLPVSGGEVLSQLLLTIIRSAYWSVVSGPKYAPAVAHIHSSSCSAFLQILCFIPDGD